MREDSTGFKANLLLAVLLLFLFGSALASERTIYTELTSFSHSETVSVYAWFHDLEGDTRRGDRAFTHNRIEVGVRWDRWQLAIVKRYDYQVRFHPDSFELLYQEENNLPVDRGRHYPIYLDVSHTQSSGIAAAYRWQPIPELVLIPEVTLLLASELYDGQLSSDIITAEDSYEGNGYLDYYYTDDPILERPIDWDPEGKGIQVDLKIDWQLNEAWSLHGQFEDLFTRIYWDDAPFTRATLTSETATFAPDGTLITTPSLSGIEGRESFTQRLATRSDLSVSWQSGDQQSISGGLKHINSVTLPYVEWRYRLQQKLAFSLGWMGPDNAVSIGLRSNWLSFGLTSDSIDYQKAHTFGVLLSVNLHI